MQYSKENIPIKNMRIEDREDFVDLVAQAVIDRIEEHDRITGLVNTVVQRVMELQKEQAEVEKEQAEVEQELAAQATDHDKQDPTTEKERADAGE